MMYKLNKFFDIFNKIVNLMFMMTLDQRISLEIRKEYSARIKDIKNEMEELINGQK